MGANVSDISTGLRIPIQVPLDPKAWAVSELALSNLGPSDNLAYTYFDGIIIICQQEKTRWEWREVIGNEVGLIQNNFQYPPNWIVFGINYSSKNYNFFQKKDLVDDKLDKGNYNGTATTLDERIVVLENNAFPPPFGTFEWIARGTNHSNPFPIAGDVFRGMISSTEYSECMTWNGIGALNNTNLVNFDIKTSIEI